jgi:1-acyl-sn-glycerol-3-phosphate acyltransferase
VSYWELTTARRLALTVQREVSRFLSPVSLPIAAVFLRYYYRLRFQNLTGIRRKYREIIRNNDRPLLICANHLTLIDSLIIVWALAPASWYLFNFSALPWHVPERRNFASSWYSRFLTYVLKCVHIVRGSAGREVAQVLRRLIYLLSKRQIVMMFPDGGRSRTGRIETDTPAHGIGRVIAALPDCRVLCVYLRGDKQKSWSDFPVRKDNVYVDVSLIEPKSEERGVRKSRDLVMQVASQLAAMEQRYFARATDNSITQ